MVIGKLFGHNVLDILESRIKGKDRKDGVYYYDIRHSDSGFEPATIEKSVWVNHMFTIVLESELDLGEDGYIVLNDEDGEKIWNLFQHS